MRTILWAPCTLLNLKTRRPKERPTTISTMAKVAGKDVNISLPIADYPTMLFFPRLGPPGILARRPRDHADMRGMWIYQLNLNPLNLAKYGIQNMASAVMDTTRLSQMFAKIAHSYAVACLGLDSFTPMLLDHILRPEGYPWHFVGGGTDAPSASGALHEIGYEEIDASGTRYIIVRLRLFAYLGAPEYVIVTGRIDSNAHSA